MHTMRNMQGWGDDEDLLAISPPLSLTGTRFLAHAGNTLANLGKETGLTNVLIDQKEYFSYTFQCTVVGHCGG
jgi:hypothetical protein